MLPYILIASRVLPSFASCGVQSDVTLAESFAFPRQVALDYEGRLLVADQLGNAVFRMDRDGSNLVKIANIEKPENVAFDPSNGYIVSVDNQGRAKWFDPEKFKPAMRRTLQEQPEDTPTTGSPEGSSEAPALQPTSTPAPLPPSTSTPPPSPSTPSAIIEDPLLAPEYVMEGFPRSVIQIEFAWLNSVRTMILANWNEGIWAFRPGMGWALILHYPKVGGFKVVEEGRAIWISNWETSQLNKFQFSMPIDPFALQSLSVPRAAAHCGPRYLDVDEDSGDIFVGMDLCGQVLKLSYIGNVNEVQVGVVAESCGGSATELERVGGLAIRPSSESLSHYRLTDVFVADSQKKMGVAGPAFSFRVAKIEWSEGMRSVAIENPVALISHFPGRSTCFFSSEEEAEGVCTTSVASDCERVFGFQGSSTEEPYDRLWSHCLCVRAMSARECDAVGEMCRWNSGGEFCTSSREEVAKVPNLCNTATSDQMEIASQVLWERRAEFCSSLSAEMCGAHANPNLMVVSNSAVLPALGSGDSLESGNAENGEEAWFWWVVTLVVSLIFLSISAYVLLFFRRLKVKFTFQYVNRANTRDVVDGATLSDSVVFFGAPFVRHSLASILGKRINPATPSLVVGALKVQGSSARLVAKGEDIRLVASSPFGSAIYQPVYALSLSQVSDWPALASFNKTLGQGPMERFEKNTPVQEAGIFDIDISVPQLVKRLDSCKHSTEDVVSEGGEKGQRAELLVVPVGLAIQEEIDLRTFFVDAGKEGIKGWGGSFDPNRLILSAAFRAPQHIILKFENYLTAERTEASSFSV